MKCGVAKTEMFDSMGKKMENLQYGKRIAYLDALKTFAILLVIEGHVRILGMGISPNDSLSGMMFYSFNIPIFFFVSGYLAYKATLSIKETYTNIKKKFCLLVIPAIVFRTALNLIEQKNIISPLFDGFGKYWFTITLFECFFIYYILLCTIKKSYFVYATMILISLISIAVLSTLGHIQPRILDCGHFGKYFYFFTLGIFARKYQSCYSKLIYSQMLRTIVIAAFFLLLFIVDYDIWPNSVFHLLRDIVLRVMGTFLVVSFFAAYESSFNKTKWLNYLITEIGRITLPIYLLQYFFIPNFNFISERITLLDMFTIHLISFGYTFFITISCILFICIIGQSKYLKKILLGVK